MTFAYVLLGVLVLVVFYGIYAYNRFISLRNRAEESWADIDVQLKRRYDLIPNLVSTVKGYAAHEASTFDRVTQARTAAMGAQSPTERGKSENMLTDALKSLFAVAEAYPDLKANQNFLELQRELSDTENKIQAARRFYNTMVLALNTALETFPSSIVGTMFNFSKREYFELGEGEAAAKEPVKVSF
jgi:LemA protein